MNGNKKRQLWGVGVRTTLSQRKEVQHTGARPNLPETNGARQIGRLIFGSFLSAAPSALGEILKDRNRNTEAEKTSPGQYDREILANRGTESNCGLSVDGNQFHTLCVVGHNPSDSFFYEQKAGP